MNKQGIPILAAEQATQRYPLPRTNPFRRAEVPMAVEATDFCVHASESVGIIGESGSGKTTLCRMLVGQEKPAGGRILHRGHDVWARGFDTLSYRRSVQVIFQNPKSSFDPRMTVGEVLREPMRSLKIEGDAESRILTVLDQVDLDSRAVECFPHEFSGGQLQCLVIVHALIPGPEVLVADEPVSALDMSIQAQVLNLLKDLVRDLGLALVMIAHDLSVVGCTAGRVYVMLNTHVIEKGEPSRPFFSLLAPETRELVGAILNVGDGFAEKGLD